MATDVRQRALAAVDDAFADSIKARFMLLPTNAESQGIAPATAEFRKGLGELHAARTSAIDVINSDFGGE